MRTRAGRQRIYVLDRRFRRFLNLRTQLDVLILPELQASSSFLPSAPVQQESSIFTLLVPSFRTRNIPVQVTSYQSTYVDSAWRYRRV
jgi:hypothetical protein